MHSLFFSFVSDTFVLIEKSKRTLQEHVVPYLKPYMCSLLKSNLKLKDECSCSLYVCGPFFHHPLPKKTHYSQLYKYKGAVFPLSLSLIVSHTRPQLYVPNMKIHLWSPDYCFLCFYLFIWKQHIMHTLWKPILGTRHFIDMIRNLKKTMWYILVR